MPREVWFLRLVALCSSRSWGGTENWVLRTCEHLRRHGVDCRLVVKDLDLFRRRMDGGSEGTLPLDRLRLRNDGDLPSVLRLAVLCRRHADVLLVTRVRDYWLGGLAGRLAGVPVLLRLGVVRPLRNEYLFDRLRYGVLPRAILVNARETRNVLEATPWLRGMPIHVVYNGVAASGPVDPAARDHVRREAGVAETSVLVVGAGRLAVEKRWSWLIEATADLVRSGADVTTVLCGEGNERANLEAAVDRWEIGGRFRFLGYREDVSRWIAAADVVALPSSNEGTSNTVLEALGFGVAVAATAAGGVAEILESGTHALLTPVDDYGAFRDALRCLVDDPVARRELGQRGLHHVRANLTWDAMAIRLREIIDEMTRGRDGRLVRRRS